MKHAHLTSKDGSRLAWVIKNTVKFYKRKVDPKRYRSPQFKGEQRYKSHAEALFTAQQWVM